MIPAIVLLIWMAVGATIAVATAPADEPKYAWVPMAVFLGPFWAVIVAERSAVAPAAITVPASHSS